MIASVTRLRLRSFLFLPGFALYAVPSLLALRKAAGFRDGSLLPDNRLAFWTLTRWNDVDAMKLWRGDGAHGQSMRKLAGWCDEASVVRWNMDESSALPTWEECHRRMVTEGRLSPVNRPSPDQVARVVPLPNTARAVSI